MKFTEMNGKDHYIYVVLHKLFFTPEPHPSATNGSIPDNVILKGKRCKHFALVCQRQA